MERNMHTDAPARVVVLAPSPVLTVTVERRGRSADEVHLHAGGQGVWVARMAALLGAEVTLCAALGGESGIVLAELIRRQGPVLRTIAATSANGAYVHDRRGGSREPIAQVRSPALKRHEVDELYGAMTAAALTSDVAVLTGTEEGVLPADVYRRLAADLRRNEVAVIADLTGEALDGALEGGLDLLKLSQDELAEITSGTLDSVSRLAAAIRTLQGRGAENVVISRAREPALASIEGSLFELRGPIFEPLDHHGAGDSMVAALAVGTARRLDLPSVLRLAVAAGALNVTRHGLGSGQRDDIERLAAAVDVRRLDDS
jgi:1-phosphofructokinase